jgi:hypothetical protein
MDQTNINKKQKAKCNENLKIGDIKLTDFIAVLKTNVTWTKL